MEVDEAAEEVPEEDDEESAEGECDGGFLAHGGEDEEVFEGDFADAESARCGGDDGDEHDEGEDGGEVPEVEVHAE